MIRLFRYENCSEYVDFPNDLFRRTDLSISFSYEEDKVVIENKPYKLSNILHIQGSGSPNNSIESSLFIKLKTNIKLALQTLFNC